MRMITEKYLGSLDTKQQETALFCLFWVNHGPRPRTIDYSSRGSRLKPSIREKKIGQNQYRHVSLHKDGKEHSCYVQRLVLEAFSGEKPAGLHAAHLNGDPSDNRIENLEWKTIAENAQDRILHGTSLAGEKHNLCKLTAEIVVEIYSKFHFGERRGKICKDYGISKTHVLQIGTKRNWKTVLDKVFFV